MTNDADERAARLAEQLRANLRRRKERARAVDAHDRAVADMPRDRPVPSRSEPD